MSLFPSIFFSTISAFSMYGEYVVRSFLLSGAFLPCDHGLDVDISLLCENSTNQPIMRTAAILYDVRVFRYIVVYCNRLLYSYIILVRCVSG